MRRRRHCPIFTEPRQDHRDGASFDRSSAAPLGRLWPAGAGKPLGGPRAWIETARAPRWIAAAPSHSSTRHASARCRGGRRGTTSITSNRGASCARSGRASRKAEAARAMRRRWRGNTAAAAAANIAARLDLDDREHAAAPREDVDLARRAAPIARDDPPAAEPQVPAAEKFAEMSSPQRQVAADPVAAELVACRAGHGDLSGCCRASARS